MRPIRRRLLALLGLLALSCTDPTAVPETGDPWQTGIEAASLAIVATLPSTCGDPTVTPLIADETITVGSVEVTQDGAHVYVVYRTDPGWPIHETAVFVGSSLADLPTSGGGNPQVGRFPHAASHGGTNEVVWAVPLASLSSPEIVVAAFAEVGATREGAWGEGERISPHGNWSMYFAHAVPGCVVGSIDQAGGEVTSLDGKASLTVDPGALEGAVDITIEPATADDLLDQVPPEEVDSELGTVFGVTLIGGTVWDLGPDGLEFLTPATIVLHYDEADLPPGVAEEDLGAFAFDGTFEALPSTVDTEANTITATIEHFTFVLSGWGEQPEETEVDLRPFSRPQAFGEMDTPMRFEASVINELAPSRGGTLIYEGVGDLLLGEIPDSCTQSGPLVIECPFEAEAFIFPFGPGEMTAAIGWFEVIPQSNDFFTYRVTVVPVSGDTDVNPDNNQLEFRLPVGLRQVDLELTGFAVTGSTLTTQFLDSDLRVSVDLRNLGPDESRGAYVEVELTTDSPNLSLIYMEENNPSCISFRWEFDVNPWFQVRCRTEWSEIAAGGAAATAFDQLTVLKPPFVDQGVPPLGIWVHVSATVGWEYAGIDVDPNVANNRKSTRVFVPWDSGTPPPDDNVPDLILVESDGSTVVSEGGGTDEFTVALTTQPATDVFLTVTSNDPGEATVAPATLMFTSLNWDVPKTVTVTGVDDAEADGDQGSKVYVAVDADASDDSYDGIFQWVSVTTTDDDD
jgi:hypothetical protein